MSIFLDLGVSNWPLAIFPRSFGLHHHLGEHVSIKFLFDCPLGGYLDLSWPSEFVKNLVGRSFKPYVVQLGFFPSLLDVSLEGHLGSSGPSGFLSLPVPLSFGRLSEPIWTKWVCEKSCWEPIQTLLGPTWILSILTWLLFGRLSGPIWTKWGFIPSCSAVSWGSISTYLDQMGLRKILLGTLPNPTWSNLELIPPCLNFVWEAIWTYMGQVGFYPFLLSCLFGGYLNLSGPNGFARNLVGNPSKP